MLAIGAGGLEVALAMAGEPFFTRMPWIWGVRLSGQLPDWVSAKDVILELLRRHGVGGGLGRIAEFSFDRLDPTYAARSKHVKGDVVVGGSNYGQGSSREHAALGPQYLGLRAVLAKGFARIHSQNLINFGVLPLTFIDLADYDGIQAGDVLRLADLRRVLVAGGDLLVENVTRQYRFQVRHSMSPRQVQVLLSGGLINWMKERLASEVHPSPAAHDRPREQAARG